MIIPPLSPFPGRGAAPEDYIERADTVMQQLPVTIAGIQAVSDAFNLGAGVLSTGYLPPVPYAAGIKMTLALQTVQLGQVTYAPIVTALPFVTSGVFGEDKFKFRVIQGVTQVALAEPGAAALVGYGKNTVSGALDLSSERTSCILPKTGAQYGFGDSQTFAVNNGIDLPYTENGRLLPQYRWLDQVGTRHGRALSINNCAIGSSRLSWVPGADADYPMIGSHFNRMGLLPYDWTGLVVGMCGWNNIHPDNDGDAAFYAVLRRSHEAMIARALLDDWFGITHLGWSRAAGAAGTTYQWQTNATDADLGPQIQNAGQNTNPFYYGAASGSRYCLDLTAGKYVQFGVQSSRAVALFFDTSPSSTPCVARVIVNDVVIGSYSTNYIGPGVYEHDTFPYVVFLDEIPPDAVVRVECVTGIVRWLAGGIVSHDGGAARNRTVLYGTTTGNTANGRTTNHLQMCAKQTEAAVAAFSDRYPVYLVNNVSNWSNATDQEPTDISHLTDVGNEKVHQNYARGYKPGGASSSNVISVPAFMARSVRQDGCLDVQKGWTLNSFFSRFRDLSGNVLAILARVDEAGVQSNDLNIRAFDRVLLSGGNVWKWGLMVSSSVVRVAKPFVIGTGVENGNYAAVRAAFSNATVVAFGPVGPGAYTDRAIGVIGASPGDTVTAAATDGFFEVGISIQAACLSANTVTVRATNTSSAGITVGARAIRVNVIAQDNS